MLLFALQDTGPVTRLARANLRKGDRKDIKGAGRFRIILAKRRRDQEPRQRSRRIGLEEKLREPKQIVGVNINR